jgi:LysR family transcriptional activator of nhaA
MMNFSHLRYFWAVAHEGNLTRAAESLHVSQSAVSVQIQKLEAALGQPLFERRGRQLVLSHAGRIALDHADAIFVLGDRLTAAMRTDPESVQQSLRIGALATLSRNFQLSFLAPVLGRDHIAITIRSGAFRPLLRMLEAHRIDVLLTDLAPPRESDTAWIPHPIAEQPVALIGHPSRLGRRRDWRTLLASEPLVVPTPESSIRTSFDALTYRLGITPRIVAEADDMAMLRLLVRQDVGLAVIPAIVVRDELESGALRNVARLPGLVETFYAITLPRAFPNPLLASLIPNSPAASVPPVAAAPAGARTPRPGRRSLRR